MLRIDDFRHIVPDNELAAIYRKARAVSGLSVAHINSTFQGGGVAEILNSLVPLMNDAGMKASWLILHGTADFFETTKGFHNALQGNRNLSLTTHHRELYERTNEDFCSFTDLHHGVVVIHDPQPLALIRYYRKTQPWVWQCHIDLSDPDPVLYDYLKGFLLQYDQMVVSNSSYLKEDIPTPQRIIYPAINPLTAKNKTLPEATIRETLDRAGIPTEKPIISQVSRLDPWKDPEGVIDVFEIVRQQCDCRLILCYNAATDDPEGLKMYQRVYQRARQLVESGDMMLVVGNTDTVVNAIQSVSAVVVQKSIREGFCLAVTEALWKGRPVVASKVGGIPNQIEDGVSGYLVAADDANAFAERIAFLLQHPKEAEAMGKKGKERVRDRFLITRLLSDYLDMLAAMIRS
jgi:trehalose synthase